MKNTPEWLALQQAYVVCRVHEEALRDAIDDLKQRKLAAADLVALGKEDRRLLDQFAYRYTRLQDDMGARLIPAALRALGEEISTMPMLDRLSRMEQLGWLPDAEEWADLRRIRNEFAHDLSRNDGGAVRTAATCYHFSANGDGSFQFHESKNS